MCGIVGMIGRSLVNQTLYDALTIIQHRGQDAAGIMTGDGHHIHLRKSNGLVRDAIREKHMHALTGTVGIGHVRYPTAGSDSEAESQPFYVNSPYGIGVVHNGNLINSHALTDELMQMDLRHLNTQSDSEVLLNVLAYELNQQQDPRLQPSTLFDAMTRVYQRLKGAFSALAMINGHGLLAFRDAYGIRPLVYGQRQTSAGTEYMVASETIALNVLGFEVVADVQPGEAIWITMDGQLHRHQCVPSARLHPCIFEYIYLARPDSVLSQISVYKARQNMGVGLAAAIAQQYPQHDIDVVIPIPDTSRTAALTLSQALGLPFSEGFVKNRYIGRTFIMPGQCARRNSVRLKLNAMSEEFRDKNVLLVDDSIVRGTTSREIVQMARDAGAKRVYFASAAPKVCYPNVYGIDMPVASELIAHQRTIEEVAELIGADWLLYQDLPSVVSAINDAAPSRADRIERFEDSIFSGDYITGDVGDDYLQRVSALRSDESKQSKITMTEHHPGDDNIRVDD